MSDQDHQWAFLFKNVLYTEMISRIDISKFGLFIDYEWSKSIGGEKADHFRRVNVIYGRNYSGKTTLSRILRSVEKNELHPHYPEANFKIITSNEKSITNASLNSCSNELTFRVYNTDFVNENLNWLHNSDGTIRPFTILGSKNVDVDRKIKEIEDKLGNVDAKTGLAFDLHKQMEIWNEVNSTFSKKKNELEGSLRTKAQSIKNTPNLYNVTTYQINSIRADIPEAKEKGILSNEEIDLKKLLLKEESIRTITRLSQCSIDFVGLFSRISTALRKKVEPSEAIIELIKDNLLQDWVRKGIELHKNKNEKCGFCGGKLSEDLWLKLDAHFNEESESLRKVIAQLIDETRRVKSTVRDLVNLDKNSFYASLHQPLDKNLKTWDATYNKTDQTLERLLIELQNRDKAIFQTIENVAPEDPTEKINLSIKELNKLIDEHNTKTSTLEQDQKQARVDLRISEVARYLSETAYFNNKTELDELEKKVTENETRRKELEISIQTLEQERKQLELQSQDESKGAALVNEHLAHFFGHDELKLVSEGKSPNVRFKIVRGSADAKNLSEGECSLISFCYFIAKIEDELKDDRNNNRLIIYIDDPISSLDSNHIFFMYSLIETVVAKPKAYGQLFISTHSLDFFKYIKRITTPGGKDTIAFYLIERRQKKNDRKSSMVKMPSHLRDYVTEFNYLFNEIYKVYRTVEGDRKKQIEETYNQFYNLPNNLRKFLECYLFYRYPNNGSPLDNLSKLFDDNVPALINRVIHEYSHLTYIDRGWSPIDVQEAEECARVVIEKIKEKDNDQFEALLSSVK